MHSCCALFDMDGTIYDSGIDFLAIRKHLGLPQNGTPILDQLGEVSPEDRAIGLKLLHEAEAAGAANGKLIAGTEKLLSWLKEQGVRSALVTNNSRASVDAIVGRHPALLFDTILTRDDGIAKPQPDLFLKALKHFEIQPLQAVAVGDTHLDALAAHRAGIRKILLVALRDWMSALIPSDVSYQRIESLSAAREHIAGWLSGHIR